MVQITRTGPTLRPDPSRLILKPFLPNGPNFGGSDRRLSGIVDRLLLLAVDDRQALLDVERARAAGRHRDLESTWVNHFRMASALVPALAQVEDSDTQLIVGAYLTQAYAYEGVSLTNPSMVPVGSDDDETQSFVMSARAIGEGHISSIAFLTGRAYRDGSVEIDPRKPFVTNGERRGAQYERRVFERRLLELGVEGRLATRILGHLSDVFDITELEGALREERDADIDAALLTDALRTVHWLAASNYVIQFDPVSHVSERVLSPAAPLESRGMEDARFARFVDDDGEVVYFATYTAFDGRRILPQMIRTEDFTEFRIATMSGPMAHNKGIAIFPRRINGEFVALSRHDNESLFVMRSDNIRHWSTAEPLIGPEYVWEAVQLGNCGAPLETDEGWLVITHGVGSMRRYVLGAILLDLDEPAKVLARLPTPLLEPADDEQNGLVPNVVYSCGGMVHGGSLVLPYGYADYGIRFASLSISELLSEMI